MPSEPVQKVEIKLTVLMRAESASAARAELTDMELDDIVNLVTNEDAIAGLSILSATTVLPKDIESELGDIGNDGTFFEVDEDEGDDESEGDDQ